jgi:2,3-bisphosphoglycerate-independent phosphoglycerate mutase
VPFEERPWMKSAEIADVTITRLEQNAFRFGRINFANGDMVGHTGDRRAAILGVETVDLALGRLLTAVRRAGGVALVTADHGNSDEMYERDKTGRFQVDTQTGRPTPRTSHSLNPVPFILYDPVALDAANAGVTRPPAGIGRGLASWPRANDAPGGPWPFSLAQPEGGAGLANVAATCLELLGWEAPAGFAASLLRR